MNTSNIITCISKTEKKVGEKNSQNFHSNTFSGTFNLTLEKETKLFWKLTI